MSNVIESPSGWVYRSDQENGDNVDCRSCGNALNDDLPIYTNKEGYAFCSEVCILDDHDAGEELHCYRAAQDEDDVVPRCYYCGDNEDGLMHMDSADRDIKPLLWEDN